ncbi:MAG: class I tRNA ligase family protein [Hydrogenophaga sp.]|nr:class I tRNA ligase family protein [Hydrogenophaga sp.]
MAQRYLDSAVPSMDPKHRQFIATVCAFNATKSRTAGDLDWEDDADHWHCAEYAQFVADYPDATTPAAYALASLAFTRVKALVILTLSAFGPAGRVPQRQAGDAQMAAERHAQAQQLDVPRFEAVLSEAFTQAWGQHWRHQAAARSLFERLCAQRRAEKQRSMESFHQEVSGFLQDDFTLHVCVCPSCAQQGRTDRAIAMDEAHLPPFDLGCDCQVHWEHDWLTEPKTADTPRLDAAIEQWVKSNVHGGSIQVPTIEQLVAFEHTKLIDATRH